MRHYHVATAFSALSSQDVLSVQRLSGGSSIPSWQVTTSVGVYAVRLYPTEHAAAVYGQARLLNYLAEQRYPVPEVVLAGTYEALHVLAPAWLKALPILDVLRATPEQANRLGEAFGEVHARLHTIPVTADMRAALPLVMKPGGQPAGDAVLIHLDYHPLNVLTDGDCIAGVIDWENVRLGDARFDVARTLSILCTDPSLQALSREERLVMRLFRQAYLKGYRRLVGRDALTPLAPFLAWAGESTEHDLRHFDIHLLTRIVRWTSWWQHQSG